MTTRKPADEALEEERDAESEALAQAEAENEPSDELEGVEAAEIEAQGEPDVSLEKLQARARKLEPEEVARIVEGLLFVSDKPLTLEAVEKASGIGADSATAAFQTLKLRYEQARGGIVLHEVAGGWQLRSAPEAAEYVRRMLQIKPQRLTRAALETLAIIAYRQPITRPEVEDIRAVDSGAIIKALLERKLIKILGKKEEPGHPLLYGTTREFLEFFNLKNLASLPTLREFQELTEESREIVEKETGQPVAAIQGTVAALADAEFVSRQKASTEASEKALEELEHAMEAAEAKARETHDILNPKPPGEAVPGATPNGEVPAAPAHDTQPDVPVAPPEAPPPGVEQNAQPADAPVQARPPRKRKQKEPQQPAAEAPPAPEPERKE